MSPPKKQTTVASDFFTRGKKPTTNVRVITTKNATVPASTPPKPFSKKQIEDDIDEVQDFDSGEDEDNAHAESEATEEHDEENQEEDEEDLSVVRDDEIQSDDSTDFGFEHKVERATPMSMAMQHRLPGRVATTSARRAQANSRKKIAVSAFVDVGDIHVGFHQADLSEQEKLLRQFDLSYKYGPCTDMTRMERWERAFTLGLNPPQHIKDTLLEHSSLNTPLFEGRV